MRASGSLTIHTSTGNVTIAGADLEFELESTDNRSMGVEKGFRAVYEDDKCSVTVDVYTYPESQVGEPSIEVTGGKLTTNSLNFHS